MCFCPPRCGPARAPRLPHGKSSVNVGGMTKRPLASPVGVKAGSGLAGLQDLSHSLSLLTSFQHFNCPPSHQLHGASLAVYL